MAVEQTPETNPSTGITPVIDDSLEVDALLLGRYRVTKTISRSEVSIVQRAVDKTDGKNVAIKTLVDVDPESIKLFSKDVKALSTVSHSNLVQFIEYQEPYYVMKFVTGFTLDKLLSKVKVFGKVGDVSRIFEQIMEPLIIAHEHEIVHGQLTPQNILFEKVDDHVLVRLVGFGESRVRQSSTKEIDASKLPFICPQDRDQFCPTVQSDVYSIGATMYLALTGKTPPLRIDNSIEEFVRNFQSLISSNLDNSRYLAVLVHKSMSPDLSERYSDVKSLKRAFDMWRQSLRKSKTSPSLKPTADVSSNTSSTNPVVSHAIKDTANLPVVNAEKFKCKLPVVPPTVEKMLSEASSVTPQSAYDTAEQGAAKPFFDVKASSSRPRVKAPVRQKEVLKGAPQITPDDDKNSELSSAIASLASRIADAPASLVGQILAERYVILELCSNSELTVVYLATDLDTDEPVVMKTLRSPTDKMREAFAKEVGKVKTLMHPNLVTFLNYQEIDDHPFYITELVEGPTISELLESIGRMETEEQIAISIIQICEAVEFLQDNDLYFGNLNTESILLFESEGAVLVKLAGIGAGEVRRLFNALNPEKSDVRYYANLEHQNRVAKSGQTSIYEVGAVAFEMITGRKPFETYATESLSLDSSEISMEKITFLRPNLFKVDDLDALLKRALSPTSNQNYQHLSDLKKAIESWIQSTRDELSLSLSENSDATSTGTQARPWHSQKSDSHEDDQKIGELKSAQIKGEKTFGMLFTKIVSVKGRRESPLYTIFQLVFLTTAAITFIFATARYVQDNHETIRAQYLTLAQQVSNQVPIGKKRSKTTLSLDSQHYSYEEDPAYQRWCSNKIVGIARRVDGSGNLTDK